MLNLSESDFKQCGVKTNIFVFSSFLLINLSNNIIKARILNNGHLRKLRVRTWKMYSYTGCFL